MIQCLNRRGWFDVEMPLHFLIINFVLAVMPHIPLPYHSQTASPAYLLTCTRLPNHFSCIKRSQGKSPALPKEQQDEQEQTRNQDRAKQKQREEEHSVCPVTTTAPAV